MIIKLPFPPTVNTYYRNVNGRTLISRRGREFRKLIQVLAMVERWPQFGKQRIRVTITANPPDRRRRDLDNLLKSTFDSLTHAGVWHDDCQIDDFRIIRGEAGKPGDLIMEIESI